MNKKYLLLILVSASICAIGINDLINRFVEIKESNFVILERIVFENNTIYKNELLSKKIRKSMNDSSVKIGEFNEIKDTYNVIKVNYLRSTVEIIEDPTKPIYSVFNDDGSIGGDL